MEQLNVAAAFEFRRAYEILGDIDRRVSSRRVKCQLERIRRQEELYDIEYLNIVIDSFRFFLQESFSSISFIVYQSKNASPGSLESMTFRPILAF